MESKSTTRSHFHSISIGNQSVNKLRKNATSFFLILNEDFFSFWKYQIYVVFGLVGFIQSICNFYLGTYS